MYRRRSIRPTPAVTVMNVRTIGTNRASTIALAPYFSKNSEVLSTYSLRNSRESGRLKMAGPLAWPIS